MDQPCRFYGKYRGTVVNNIDPMKIGRLQVIVPDVLGPTPSTWAAPCVPASGMQSGVIMAPLVGAGVWVEFEQGDPSYPIWVGGWWGSAAEAPAMTQMAPPGVSAFVAQTALQNGLMISDTPGPTGGIVIKSTTGASIIVNDTGIYIQNGKGASVTLIGPSVTVNAGALVVT